jgi:hypothetical protein
MARSQSVHGVRLKKERKQVLREFEGSASVLVKIRIAFAERSDLRLDLGNIGFVFALLHQLSLSQF